MSAASAAAGIDSGGGSDSLGLACSVAWLLCCACVCFGSARWLRWLGSSVSDPSLPWSKRGADPRGAAFFFLALRSDNPRCRLTYILGRTDILVYFE
jgi:hypothetical protein